MSFTLSPLAGAGWQFFDNSGNPLSGGLLYTYYAGTTTPITTYTTPVGNIANSNPIVLDSAGRTSQEIWLSTGYGHKFVLKDSSNVLIGTYDNIPTLTPPPVVIVNDASSIAYEQGYSVTAGSFIVGDTYLITSVGSTDFTAIGASANTPGVHFTATGVGTGTGTAQLTRTVQNKLQEAISVKDFGAVGDGTTNDTIAFNAAAAAIQAAGGGKLIIPNGTYIVGLQTFTTGFGFGATNNPISLTGCTKPVIIEGNGAIIKWASGLYFGSFDKYTKSPVVQTSPNSTLGQLGYMFLFNGCASVKITDLELDGNVSTYVIGSPYGDTGWQLAAGGIESYASKAFLCENVYAHHHGQDGFIIAWAGITTADNAYPHYMNNCRSYYNGRQGLSWVGGNHLVAVNCDFSHTGKNGYLVSAPGAGVDIENESGVLQNGTFINCRFFDNYGVGMVSDGTATTSKQMSFYSCQFIGTTNWASWSDQQQYVFRDCLFVGSVVRPGGNATYPELASQFYNCYFTFQTSYSPSGVVYESSNQRFEFDYSNNTLFDTCTFNAASLPGLPYSTPTTQYRNCNFIKKTSTTTTYSWGVYTGLNKFDSGANAASFDTGYSTYYDQVFYNGVDQNAGGTNFTGAYTVSSGVPGTPVVTGTWAKNPNNKSVVFQLNFTWDVNSSSSLARLQGLPFSCEKGGASVIYSDYGSQLYATFVPGGATPVIQFSNVAGTALTCSALSGKYISLTGVSFL